MIIDSPIISGSYLSTGSLSQTGNVSITGSLTVTAGITGSIQNAVTASYASYALTSSYSLGGSGFPFSGSAVITGSLLVSGSQTLIGSLNVNGSQSISGSLNVSESITATVVNSPRLQNGSQYIAQDTYTGITAIQNGSQTWGFYPGGQFYPAGTIAGSSYGSNELLLTNTTPAQLKGIIYGVQIVTSDDLTGKYTWDFSSATGNLTAPTSSKLIGTASWSENALTASYLLGYISPFPYTGSAAITGSLIVTGSVAISNLVTSSGVRYVIADQNGLISAQTASAAIFTTQQVTSTAGQTTFPITNGYSTGYVTVFVNGTKLSADEYVDTSGTNIVFLTGSTAGDNVEFQKYLPAAGVSNNTLRSTNYFTATTGQTNFSVNYTPGLIDIFYNGAKLDNTEYTAANGTSITLATASAAGDRLEVDVYSYQVGAFSGIGGTGAANQLAYFNTSNSITGSNAFTVSGSAVIITGSLIVSGSGTLINIGPTVFSGSVTSTAGFSGSFSGTADSASYAYTASSAINAFNSISASYAYTASSAINAFTASKAISSSYADTASFANNFTVIGNLTVFGTQSVQYITSSQLNISDNVITVNVASPGVRFGGLSVFDSGSLSSEATASLFWDSQNNHWIYQRESGSTYNGGMLISGPRNSAGLGNELGTTNNSLMKGQGGDHITSSAIFEVSGSVTMGTALTNLHNITGSLGITGSLNINISGSSTQALAVKISGSAYNGANVWFQDASATDGISFGGNGVNSYKTINTYGGALYLNNISQNGVNLFGNVGIGTTNPGSYKLHLVNSGSNAQFGISNQGTANGDRQLRIGFGGNGANTYAELQGTRLNIADDINIALQPGGGNIGIGTTSPSTLTHIHTARSSGANVDIMTLSDNVTGIQTSGFGVRILATSNNGQAKSAIAFEADGGTNNDTAIAFYTQTSAAALSQRLIIDKNGTVRVNTSVASTNYKFGVSGSAYINGTNNKGVFITDGASYASIVGLNSAISSYNSLELRASGVDGQLMLTSAGCIGFFTTSPAGSVTSNLVHVNGASAVLRVGPNYPQAGAGTDRDFIELIADGANTKLVSPNETFSILNTGGGAGSWAIDVIAGSGGVRLTNGATSWSAISSDRRKKKNFEPSQGLAEVLQIEPVKYHFEWDDDSIPKRMGFIAQNIQPLIPEMVSATKEKAPDGSDYLTVTPDYILPVLVKAIQEQNVLIQELQEKLQRNNIN